MSEVSRRTFLYTGAGAAAAGAVVATTGLSRSTDSADALGESPEEVAAVAAVTDPIVVHIKDAKTGDVSIFRGEDEVSYRDPQLVARVARATNRSRV